MSRLQFSAAEQADIEVDLWGTIFVRVPITRARRRKFLEKQAELTVHEAATYQKQAALDPLAEGYTKAVADLELNSEEEGVKLLAELFDLVLKPLVDGSRVKPSRLIVEKYKAGDVTFDDIAAFIDRMKEAAQDPPTSPTGSSAS